MATRGRQNKMHVWLCFGTTTADAVDVIGLGGVVVLVGMGKLETTIDSKSLIVNQCDLRGSNGGTPDGLAAPTGCRTV
ncbi:hypothetical protein [Bifidobacterium moukalabense]|uniref:hypothetical protein n=2 Tax=Bifidobacterium moukalabense TaxID=1333651 RepID=UPI001F2D30BA|nr:hypothetical protein [Bifidobacterium moukalabense]